MIPSNLRAHFQKKFRRAFENQSRWNVRLPSSPGRQGLHLGIVMNSPLLGSRLLRQAVMKTLGCLNSDGSPSSGFRWKDVRLHAKQGQAPRAAFSKRMEAFRHKKGFSVLHLSLAHEEETAISLAVTSDSGLPLLGVGIDMTRRHRFQRLAENASLLAHFEKDLLSEEEKNLCRHPEVSSTASNLAKIWVIKEAAYKALPDPKPSFLVCGKKITVSKNLTKPEIRMEPPLSSKRGAVFHPCLIEKDDLFLAAVFMVGSPETGRGILQ